MRFLGSFSHHITKKKNVYTCLTFQITSNDRTIITIVNQPGTDSFQELHHDRGLHFHFQYPREHSFPEVNATKFRRPVMITSCTKLNWLIEKFWCDLFFEGSIRYTSWPPIAPKVFQQAHVPVSKLRWHGKTGANFLDLSFKSCDSHKSCTLVYTYRFFRYFKWNATGGDGNCNTEC